jgi:hypothetical protein
MRRRSEFLAGNHDGWSGWTSKRYVCTKEEFERACHPRKENLIAWYHLPLDGEFASDAISSEKHLLPL